MFFLNQLILLGITASTALANTQVNFYYDYNCQNYAGAVSIPTNGQRTGGPLGSRSALFVHLNGDVNYWGIIDGNGENYIANPKTYDAGHAQCVAEVAGVYAIAGTFGHPSNGGDGGILGPGTGKNPDPR